MTFQIVLEIIVDVEILILLLTLKKIISCNSEDNDSSLSISVDSNILNDPPPSHINSIVSLQEYVLNKSFINTSSSCSDDLS